MVKFIYALLFFFFIQESFASSNNVMILGTYRSVDDFKLIKFNNDNLISFIDDESTTTDELWNRTFHYQYSLHKGIIKITLEDKRYFIGLISDIFFVLYDGINKAPLFFGGKRIKPELIYSPNSFATTSFLTEHDITYKSLNLGNLNSDSPWVEGIDGYGIGEKISFDINQPYLIFFSGYFSCKNPALYEMNSRVKILEIISSNTGKSKKIELEDVAGGQQINISEIVDCVGFKKDRVELEIIDVYKGKKYEDTCINAILIGRSDALH